MKKIDTQAAAAFVANIPFSGGNTIVTVENDTVIMRLHGHIIASMCRKDNTLALTLAGYNTMTTRARLNGILYTLPTAAYATRYVQQNYSAVLFEGDKRHEISPDSWQHFTRENASAPWIYKD